jgi:hypothetical protein
VTHPPLQAKPASAGNSQRERASTRSLFLGALVQAGGWRRGRPNSRVTSRHFDYKRANREFMSNRDELNHIQPRSRGIYVDCFRSGGRSTTAEIAAIARRQSDDVIGISLDEAKAITGGVQRAMVETQAREVIDRGSTCPEWGTASAKRDPSD